MNKEICLVNDRLFKKACKKTPLLFSISTKQNKGERYLLTVKINPNRLGHPVVKINNKEVFEDDQGRKRNRTLFARDVYVQKTVDPNGHGFVDAKELYLEIHTKELGKVDLTLAHAIPFSLLGLKGIGGVKPFENLIRGNMEIVKKRPLIKNSFFQSLILRGLAERVNYFSFL